MTFDVRAGSPDFHRPVYRFADDPDMDPRDYEAATYNGYMSSVSTFYGVARGYGMDMDGESFERLKRIWSAAGLLDDFLDQQTDPDEARILYAKNVESFASGGDLLDDENIAITTQLQNALILMRSSVQELEQNRRDVLIKSARRIGQISIDKSQCDDLVGYVDLLREEGSLTANLCTEAVSNDLYHHINFPKFSQWCVNALQAGTVLDHARDLWRDNNEGLTRVPASSRNAIKIARAALPQLSQMYSGSETRSGSFGGLKARLIFGAMPTTLAMKRGQCKYDKLLA